MGAAGQRGGWDEPRERRGRVHPILSRTGAGADVLCGPGSSAPCSVRTWRSGMRGERLTADSHCCAAETNTTQEPTQVKQSSSD